MDKKLHILYSRFLFWPLASFTVFICLLSIFTWNEQDDKAGFYLLMGAFLLICSLNVYKFYRYVWGPKKDLERQVSALLAGEDHRLLARRDGCLFESIFRHIDLYQQRLQELASLAEQIGDGNFNQEAEDFKHTGALGQCIFNMRAKIQASYKEEEKRRWSNEGINHFSGIVRGHGQDLNGLCASLLSELVPFIEANQGGLFLTEQREHDMELSLKASYAWGRQKHIKKIYQAGEGMIGQVALEKQPMFLTDVPENFITIGSGLGHAKPSCIIILPLMAEDQLHGVLELASFKVFEEHQIHFLERLCEILASAIAMTKGNNITKQLLQQAEQVNIQLKAQQEELRQNTEELMSTQEAMSKKEAELEKLQQGLEVKLQEATMEMERQIREIASEKIKNDAILEGCVDGVVSFNEQGQIQYFNKAAEAIWEVSRQEAMENKIQDYIPVEIMAEDDEWLVYYAKNGGRKILDARTEVPVFGKSGQEMEVLLTLTKAKVEGAYTFTAFAQKVAIELF